MMLRSQKAIETALKKNRNVVPASTSTSTSTSFLLRRSNQTYGQIREQSSLLVNENMNRHMNRIGNMNIMNMISNNATYDFEYNQSQYRLLSTKNNENNDTEIDKEKDTKEEEEEVVVINNEENVNDNDNDEKIKETKKESFEETINRLQGDKDKDSSYSSSKETDDILRNISDAIGDFKTTLSDTWVELIDSSKARDVNKKLSDIHNSKPGNVNDDDNEAADRYDGTTAIMLIDEEENLNAYERIQKRLSEAPLIQDILKKADEIYETSGAAKAGEKISHIKEDAQEAWETSQSPWVYRASSVYDTITAESENAMAERELRELDPHFSLEDWQRGLLEVTLPNFMQLFLEGRIKELKPMLGEGVYNKLAAESRERKKEGVYIDTNILGIMNSEILSCTPDSVNKGSPIIMVHFMCQQINCVRKKETDEITVGSEDDIRAYSYVVAMQREYDEEKGELNWKIMDLMLNGAIAYL